MYYKDYCTTRVRHDFVGKYVNSIVLQIPIFCNKMLWNVFSCFNCVVSRCKSIPSCREFCFVCFFYISYNIIESKFLIWIRKSVLCVFVCLDARRMVTSTQTFSSPDAHLGQSHSFVSASSQIYHPFRRLTIPQI